MRRPRPTEPVASEITLAALPSAVSCARLFVRYTLGSWPAERIKAAETVVAELVADAVRRTGVVEPAPTWTQLATLGLLVVRLRLVDNGLMVEVLDAEAASEHRGGHALDSGRYREQQRIDFNRAAT